MFVLPVARSGTKLPQLRMRYSGFGETSRKDIGPQHETSWTSMKCLSSSLLGLTMEMSLFSISAHFVGGASTSVSQ